VFNLKHKRLTLYLVGDVELRTDNSFGQESKVGKKLGLAENLMQGWLCWLVGQGAQEWMLFGKVVALDLAVLLLQIWIECL